MRLNLPCPQPRAFVPCHTHEYRASFLYSPFNVLVGVEDRNAPERPALLRPNELDYALLRNPPAAAPTVALAPRPAACRSVCIVCAPTPKVPDDVSREEEK